MHKVENYEQLKQCNGSSWIYGCNNVFKLNILLDLDCLDYWVCEKCVSSFSVWKILICGLKLFSIGE